MPGFVVGGGKVDTEGFLKFLLLMVRQGYATGLNLTQRAAGANMSVDANVNASGYAGGILNTSANVPYFGWIAATENISVNASDPTNPRIDTVVAYVDLSVISSAITNNTGALKFKAVAGTPAGSPSAPSAGTIQASIGAGYPYITLGNLAVVAAASAVVNANITDTRVPMAYAVPYLYGGALNAKGHLVPNIADDTVALLAAVQTLTNKALSTGTTFDNNLIPAAALATSAITLGYAQITADFTTVSTSYVTATGLTVAVTIPAGGRKVKITAWTKSLVMSVNGGIAAMSIWDGTVGSGTQLTEAQVTNPSATPNESTAVAIAIVTPAAGSKTYNVGLKTSSGAGFIRAGSTYPAFILVEAI